MKMTPTLDELKAERVAARAAYRAASNDYWITVGEAFKASPRNEVDYSAAMSVVRAAFEKCAVARVARDAADKAYSRAVRAEKAKKGGP
jgi:hypothetical protein